MALRFSSQPGRDISLHSGGYPTSRVANLAPVHDKIDEMLRNQKGLGQLVDPARQAQNAAEAAARIADIEVKVASAAEIGAAAQPVLAALERMEASLAAQNTRLAALEARPQCCIVS